jgi:hypothetical protein
LKDLYAKGGEHRQRQVVLDEASLGMVMLVESLGHLLEAAQSEPHLHFPSDEWSKCCTQLFQLLEMREHAGELFAETLPTVPLFVSLTHPHFFLLKLMEGGDPSVAHWCLTLSMMGQEVYPLPVHDADKQLSYKQKLPDIRTQVSAFTYVHKNISLHKYRIPMT